MTDPVVPIARHAWHWHRHPAFRDIQRTRGEKAADIMRDRMGSWGFVFGFLTTMLLWMLVNSVWRAGFDRYPFILLNLLLSTLAGLQGGILLIASKRSDQMAAAVAMHTLEETVKTSAKLDAMAAHLGVQIPADTLTVPDRSPPGS